MPGGVGRALLELHAEVLLYLQHKPTASFQKANQQKKLQILSQIYSKPEKGLHNR